MSATGDKLRVLVSPFVCLSMATIEKFFCRYIGAYGSLFNDFPMEVKGQSSVGGAIGSLALMTTVSYTHLTLPTKRIV